MQNGDPSAAADVVRNYEYGYYAILGVVVLLVVLAALRLAFKVYVQRFHPGLQRTRPPLLYRLLRRPPPAEDGDPAALAEAVEACRRALREADRDSAPADWADIQSDLGKALAALGAAQPDDAAARDSLAAAVEAFGNAVEGYATAGAAGALPDARSGLEAARELLERRGRSAEETDAKA